MTPQTISRGQLCRCCCCSCSCCYRYYGVAVAVAVTVAVAVGARYTLRVSSGSVWVGSVEFTSVCSAPRHRKLDGLCSCRCNPVIERSAEQSIDVPAANQLNRGVFVVCLVNLQQRPGLHHGN